MRARTLPLRRLTSAAVLALVATSGGLASSVLDDGGTASAAGLAGLTAARATANPVTPGDFTGYGFDQCRTPDQTAMDAWRAWSPFTAVGIYISGNSRACRDQPNLTADWVRTQLRRGWRLLPITLGPQASCQPRFPRYGDDPTIDPRPGRDGTYARAAAMGTAEADKTVGVAGSLGIVPGSTLWYDLEGFDSSNTRCRESALHFLSAWTDEVHAQGYVSGVYSSAGSGIQALDNARVNRPDAFTLPDAIWIARWDGRANTSTDYIRDDGWQPGARIKQYQGGHDEGWGGTTINIDRDFLQLGQGSVAAREPEHCGGTRINYPDYTAVRPTTADGTAADPGLVRALQCRLTEARLYSGAIDGTYGPATIAAANQWQQRKASKVHPTFTRHDWMTLLAAGGQPPLKLGSTGPVVRKVQRALNAASPDAQVVVTGVFSTRVEQALEAYQSRVGLRAGGVVDPDTWAALQAGVRTVPKQ